MTTGWRYRAGGVIGTAVITVLVVSVMNHPWTHQLAAQLPIVGRLSVNTGLWTELGIEMVTAAIVMIAASLPLYKPRPRRILDTIALAQKRVILGIIALAAIGYFDYTYRLPRLTVILVSPVLLVALPAWFVFIRRKPGAETERVIIVGDDPKKIKEVGRFTELPILGYLAPTTVFDSVDDELTNAVPDGGLKRLGGLSRIDDVLIKYDVDMVVMAFRRADRAEFFGTLDTCYVHGITVKVHRDHIDSVLTENSPVGPFVDVDIEPWDFQDYLIKRSFDIVFAMVGLIILAPITVVIAVVIKMDDGGPIFYIQERTGVFGETFDVYKFRTMESGVETPDPIGSADERRITKPGRILRHTHLDEIPQLWSILTGRMSAVGPRAAWVDEESLLEHEAEMWRKRWFVKPGLTGLAQVNDIGSASPDEKIRLDLEYVKRQSFWFDLKIVTIQSWIVIMDIIN